MERIFFLNKFLFCSDFLMMVNDFRFSLGVVFMCNIRKKIVSAVLFAIVLSAIYPCQAGQGRVLHFPENRSIGRVMIQDAASERRIETFHYWIDDIDWEYLSEAKGRVILPRGKRAGLSINKAASKDLSALSKLAADDLYMLSLRYAAGDNCMEYVADLTGLKVLNLLRTNITSRGLRHITTLKSLERLSVPKSLTDKGLKYIAELRGLKGLYFKENQVTDSGLSLLLKLTSLEELELGGENITDAGLVYLAELPCLSYLILCAIDVLV